MQQFIIAIAVSIIAPALIGAAIKVRIGSRRTQRESRPARRFGHAGNIATAAAWGGQGLGRPRLRLVCGLFAAATLGLLLVAGAADAKPKQLGVTCSTAQFVKASRCLKQYENDVMNNVANPHFVACFADGSVWCCQKSSSGPGNNCTTVRTAGPGRIYQVPLGSATSAPPTNAPTTNAPTAPGVFGGVGTFHKAQ